jgi:hypothetical protein
MFLATLANSTTVERTSHDREADVTSDQVKVFVGDIRAYRSTLTLPDPYQSRRTLSTTTQVLADDDD